MTKRREFRRSVKIEIRLRATRDGVIYCESCGLPAKTFHIDHIDADALQVDKTRNLTSADGQLLCAGSRLTCHGIKTAEHDVPVIRQAQRRQENHLGLRKASTLRTGSSLPSAAPAHRATTPPSKIAAGPSALARRMREETTP
jgi:hypothetical protein